MNCDTCAYYGWDEDLQAYVCEVSMDEDDYVRLMGNGFRSCPYYRDGNEYKIAQKQ